ncbi:MAG: DEAD/DEAH box helicase [Prevotellaceae bacterium]|jgi:SNF2 family DNA or RNA helicase|nr:DEAD/DEAH box helicase [Prevotellaceae bacterium]
MEVKRRFSQIFTSGKFVVCLIENPVWGYILQPTLVTETEYDTLLIQEIIERESSFFTELTAEQKAIVLHYEKYTEKNLMKRFSKDRNILDFREKTVPERFDRFIRPLIESVHRKMIAVIRKADIPVYLRENVKIRNLYDANRIRVSNSDSGVIFNFQKEYSGGLIYFIQVKSGNEVIDLKSRFFAVVCGEPAIVVVDDRLLTFNDIDAKKLQPFITKDNIRVHPDSYRTYIEKFVVNCIKKYEVKSTGLNINEINPEKRPLLNLTCDLNMQPVLNLSFRYDKKVFQLNHFSDQKIVYAGEMAGDTVINWYKRDRQWENSIVNLLLAGGLKQSDACNFYVETKDAADSLDKTGAILKWIRSNAEIMKRFDFSQSASKSAYYTGKIETVTRIGTKQDWFDVYCMVVFDGFEIPFSSFRNHILDGIREYVLPDKTVVVLPEEWFVRYQDIMYFGKKSGNNIHLDRHHFKLLEAVKTPEKISLTYLDSPENVPVPKGINSELYNYQKKGFSWLVHLYKNDFGGCLADDMGLGKTLQTIVLLQYIANENSLCNQTEIFPQNTVLETEAKRHSAEIQLSIFDAPATPQTGASTSVSDLISEKHPVSLLVVPTSLLFNWQNELKRFAPSLRVYPCSGKNRLKDKRETSVFSHFDVIITTYATIRNDIDILSVFPFHHLILDESQYIKNPESQTYKAVKSITAQHKLLLTGTPIENSLTDLWAQFNIINEGMLGSYSSFKKRYIKPIKKENEMQEEALLRMIQPFILRRTKNEVAPELPPLSEETVYCDMSDEQAEYYEIEKNKVRNNLISEEVMMDRKKIPLLALQGLTRLRLLANHPRFVDEEYTGGSGKFEQVIMYIEGLIAENHKVLIFSSFVKHLRLFSEYFDRQNRKYAWLSGSTVDREGEVSKFVKNDDINCFFISLKAGGVGLNLTVADYVFILDPWWNPAAEMQAVSRSHRLGQDKNVMVYRFISTKTIEEKIRHLQESKTKLAEKFVTSANPLNAMNREEIEELFGNYEL